MLDSTLETSSSISSLVEEFNIITHNLANASTTGYKRRCTAFSKALETAQSNQPEQINVDAVFDFSQGNLIQTGRPLDVALSIWQRFLCYRNSRRPVVYQKWHFYD
ncbi:MAG: flagellar basal body protein [Planctomycetota bacterium]